MPLFHPNPCAPRSSGGTKPRKGNGTRVGVAELRRLRKDALHLVLTPRDAVSSLFPGAYRSLFRGRGLEPDEVRAYQPGDDFRALDWRVTARTGRLHTKLFHEEREHSLYLVLDAGPSMHFGTRVRFKWTLAARLAALVAWLSLENGDRVGALVFGNAPGCHWVPLAGGERGTDRLFDLLARIRPPDGQGLCGLSDALAMLRRRIRRRFLSLGTHEPMIERMRELLRPHTSGASVLRTVRKGPAG